MFNSHAAGGHPARERLATPNLTRSGSRHGGQQIVNAPPEDLDPEQMARVGGERNMAERVVVLLQKLYPGHAWECTVDSRTGGVQLRIAVLMTGPHCYYFGFNDVATENSFNHFVKVAGGELLERFKIPRATFDLSAYMDAKPFAVFHHNQKAPGE